MSNPEGGGETQRIEAVWRSREDRFHEEAERIVEDMRRERPGEPLEYPMTPSVAYWVLRLLREAPDAEFDEESGGWVFRH